MATNHALAEAFRATHARISPTRQEADWMVKREYICHAIELCCKLGEITETTRDDAKYIILSRIAPYHSLESWVLNAVDFRGNSGPSSHPTNPKGTKMQATRKAWLNDLVREFSLP